MDLRADPSALCIVHTDELPWTASPMPGVWRKRLERSGPEEAGRVTSIVRYEPGSRFRHHLHPDGEEILVLQGVFSDQSGDHPAGTWLLNPDGSGHAPFTDAGCLLFVKLRQAPGADRPALRVDTTHTPWLPHPDHPSAQVLPLCAQDGHPEQVRLVRLAPGTELPPVSSRAGEEILVVEGHFTDEHGEYRTHSWVRYPPGTSHTPRSAAGCVLYVKQGHLG